MHSWCSGLCPALIAAASHVTTTGDLWSATMVCNYHRWVNLSPLTVDKCVYLAGHTQTSHRLPHHKCAHTLTHTLSFFGTQFFSAKYLLTISAEAQVWGLNICSMEAALPQGVGDVLGTHLPHDSTSTGSVDAKWWCVMSDSWPTLHLHRTILGCLRVSVETTMIRNSHKKCAEPPQQANSPTGRGILFQDINMSAVSVSRIPHCHRWRKWPLIR